MKGFVKRNNHINILLSALFLLNFAIVFSSENDSISRCESQNIQEDGTDGKKEGKLKPKRKKFKFQSKAIRKTFKATNKFNKKHRNRVGKKRFKNRHSGAASHQNKFFKQKKNKTKLKRKNFHNINSTH